MTTEDTAARTARVAIPVFGGPLDGIILTIRDIDYQVHATCQPLHHHRPNLAADDRHPTQLRTYRYSRETVHLSWVGANGGRAHGLGQPWTGALCTATGEVLIPVAPHEHREHAQHVVRNHLAYIALMLRWIGTNPRQPDQPHTHHPNM